MSEDGTDPFQPGGDPPGDGIIISTPAPAQDDEFTEHDPPASTGADWIRTKELHMSETRRTLAVGLLWVVAGLSGVPTAALIAGHWLHFTGDDYQKVSLMFTPIVALASAAFGFFFASDERNR
ncbi:hypothetical protein [Streptomyces sp. HPF1205]|uniref:hypothetical protein n=1 Tax=Streptomyces sp. HPF1205 TaxID=2873262 RepID=UPI001CED690B|nr:hypothetical protein [Streptomyces sp. HPF1205]